MKSILINGMFALLFSAGLVGQSQNLTVTVKNVKDADGFISAALYHSGDDFMKKAVQLKRTVSIQGEVQLVFDNLPPGEYAVSVMHDANKNGKLDSNFVGIPKEGFGFSNDVMGTFGPPDFKDAKFEIPAKTGIIINLKYY